VQRYQNLCQRSYLFHVREAEGAKKIQVFYLVPKQIQICFCTNEADLLDVGEAEDAKVACRQDEVGGGGGGEWGEGAW